MADNPGIEKIAVQSDWYGKQARQSRSRFIGWKSVQIVLAATIPIISIGNGQDFQITQRWLTGSMGALIGIIEGILQLCHYQENWLLFRATREALRREDLLFTSRAGPYANIPDAETQYVERTDAIMSGENVRWTSLQQGGGKSGPK